MKLFVAAMLASVCVVVPVASGRDASASSRIARATVVAPAGRTWDDEKAGLTVHYPAGWHLTTRSLTTITEPMQRFVIYSGATPRRVAVAGPRTNQVIAVVMEETSVSVPDLRRFPRRPQRVAGRHFGGGVEGFGAGWAELVFRDNGRAFYAFIGVGKNGERHLPALLRALDTLRVAP